MQVLLFRPAGDTLKWADFAKPYVDRGIISAESSPLTFDTPPQTAPVTEFDSIRSYPTKTPDETLVLGTIRYPASGLVLGYAVLIDGKLNNAHAILQAPTLVKRLLL